LPVITESLICTRSALPAWLMEATLAVSKKRVLYRKAESAKEQFVGQEEMRSRLANTLLWFASPRQDIGSHNRGHRSLTAIDSNIYGSSLTRVVDMCFDLKTYELFVRQKSTQFPPKTQYMRCPTYDKTGLKVLRRYSSDVITLRPPHSVTFRHILIRLKLPTALTIEENTLHRSRYRRPARFAAIPGD
jgi:hypothetical protein